MRRLRPPFHGSRLRRYDNHGAAPHGDVLRSLRDQTHSRTHPAAERRKHLAMGAAHGMKNTRKHSRETAAAISMRRLRPPFHGSRLRRYDNHGAAPHGDVLRSLRDQTHSRTHPAAERRKHLAMGAAHGMKNTRKHSRETAAAISMRRLRPPFHGSRRRW